MSYLLNLTLTLKQLFFRMQSSRLTAAPLWGSIHLEEAEAEGCFLDLTLKHLS